MAFFENEGYCPNRYISDELVKKNADPRVVGLWCLLGPYIVYSKEDNINPMTFNQIFTTDVIALDLLFALSQNHVGFGKISVHQLHHGHTNQQNYSDIVKIISECNDVKLIAHAGSNFIALITSQTYGINLWVWDLRITTY